MQCRCRYTISPYIEVPLEKMRFGSVLQCALSPPISIAMFQSEAPCFLVMHQLISATSMLHLLGPRQKHACLCRKFSWFNRSHHLTSTRYIPRTVNYQNPNIIFDLGMASRYWHCFCRYFKHILANEARTRVVRPFVWGSGTDQNQHQRQDEDGEAKSHRELLQSMQDDARSVCEQILNVTDTESPRKGY
jgi:hypothetical protein